MAERGGCSQPGDAQIRCHLGGVTAMLIFRHAQLLLLAATEFGSGQGEQEQRQHGGSAE